MRTAFFDALKQALNDSLEENMARPQITMDGNLIADPELKFTKSGKAVCTFKIANTARRKDGDQWVDGGTMFIRVTAWDKLAENVAATLQKGMRAIVQGYMENKPWEDKEGNSRDSYEITADNIGVSLSNQTAQVQKATNNGGGNGGFGGGNSFNNTGNNGFGNGGNSSSNSDEPPF